MLHHLISLIFVIQQFNCCSYFSLFDYRYATTKDEYKFNYDTIPLEETRPPDEAKEEAIMLIGGSFTLLVHKNAIINLYRCFNEICDY